MAVALLAACGGSANKEAVRPTHPVVPPPPLLTPGAPNSADRVLFWLSCDQVSAMDDAILDLWKSRGVDGFVCVSQSLFALGGKNHFTADVDHIPDAAEYEMERKLRASDIGRRARARDMDLYLALYLVSEENPATPLVDWFDDDGWSSRVAPAAHDLASAARQLGFKGLAFDQELYPQAGGVKTASWVWRYPGNTHSQEDTRAKVKQRGGELMDALVDGFPGLELLAYGTQFPETWAALVQQEANTNNKNAFAASVQIDFWDGISGTQGYRLIRLLNQEFYKAPGVPGASWDAALQQQYNMLFSLLSRRMSNWAYAAPRFEESPFIWISAGKSDFERARPPDAVADQLDAFSRWGMGGGFATYVFGKLDSFDYTPYVTALQAASTPRVVTDQPPTIRVTGPSTQPIFNYDGATVTLTGSSHDPYAIWYIAWSNDRGGNGTAQLTWDPGTGDDRDGYPDWDMKWTADVPLQEGVNVITLTAAGIKGLPTNAVVTVTR